MSPSVDLHPLVQPLFSLLGEWEGEGKGLWGSDFTFLDHVVFTSDERPIIEFRQSARRPDGAASHGEVGYLLLRPDGVAHMTVAEPSGVTEVLSGLVEGTRIDLRSVEVGQLAGDGRVTATARRIILEGMQLVLQVDIATEGGPLSPHTSSILSPRGAQRCAALR